MIGMIFPEVKRRMQGRSFSDRAQPQKEISEKGEIGRGKPERFTGEKQI